MAEGIVNQDFAGRVEACSAGTFPKGVSPLAAMVLKEIRIDISGHTSDHYSKYQDERFDYVITLCGDANENCPYVPSAGKRLHIGFPDPPHTDEPTEENLAIYRQVRDAIRKGLGEFFRRELTG